MQMNIIILIKLYFFEKKVSEWMMNMKNIIIRIFICIFAVAIISDTSIFIYTKYFQDVPDKKETIVETSKPIQQDEKDEKVEDTVEDIVPIVFSGKDGKLDLAGHEIEVKDISVYE